MHIIRHIFATVTELNTFIIMFTKKDILVTILAILVVIALICLIIWLIIEFTPILIVAIVFLPWLAKALSNGANV